MKTRSMLLCAFMALAIASCGPSAADLIDEGLLLYSQGENDLAIQAFSQALEVEPENSVALFHRGVVYRSQGDHEFALNDLNASLEINPEYAPAYFHRGLLNTDAGQTDEAMDDFGAAIHQDAEYAEAFLERGAIYVGMIENQYTGICGVRQDADEQSEALESALSDLNTAIELDPSMAPAFHYRGAVQFLLGDLEPALDDLDHALSLDSTLIDALLVRSQVLISLGDFQQALDDLDHALSLQPDNPQFAYRVIAQAHLQLGNFNQALDAIDQGIAIDPEDHTAYQVRGNINRAMGEINLALEDYTTAIQLRPDIADHHYNLGNVLRDLERYEDAIAEYHLALDIDPECIDALFNRGLSFKDLGYAYSALADFESLLEIDPRESEALYLRGILHIAIWDLQAASSDFETMLEIDPLDARAFFMQGRVCILNGEYENAVENLSRVLELEPQNPFAYYWRGLAYDSLEMYDEALSDLEMALDLDLEQDEADHARSLLPQISATITGSPWFGEPICVRDVDGDFSPDVQTTEFYTHDAAMFVMFPFINMQDEIVWGQSWEALDMETTFVWGEKPVWQGGGTDGVHLAYSYAPELGEGRWTFSLFLEDQFMGETTCSVVDGYWWEFGVQGDNEGWYPWNDLTPLRTAEGLLQSTSTSNDPYMMSHPISADASRLSRIEIRMRTSAGREASIFFITESDSDWGEDKALHFPVTGVGQFHIYKLDMATVNSWRGTITGLRLDPTNSIGDIEIDFMRLTAPLADQDPYVDQWLFEDDFTDTESGWPQSEIWNYGSGYSDGSYQIWVNIPNFLHVSTIDTNFGDVQIEVEARKEGGTDYSYYGLVCRAVDFDNSYMFFVGPDGFYAVAKMVEGEIMPVGMAQFLPSEIINQGSTSNLIRADCVGEQLRLIVNGRVLAEVHDSEFTFGGVGMLAGTFNEPEIIAIFDNYRIFVP